MKIHYISRSIFPSKVSHSLSIMRLCQAFVDCGHTVKLSGRSPRSGLIANLASHYGLAGGFAVELSKMGRLIDNRFTRAFFIPDLIQAYQMRRQVKSYGPDIIYSRLTLLELLFLPARIPIFYEMHSLGFLRKTKLEQTIFAWIMAHKSISKIVVTTDMLAEMLRKELPNIDIIIARLSAEKPVDLSLVEISEFRSSNLKGENFKHHIGYTGYLDNIGLRGTEYICQTAQQIPDAAFHIVGGDPEMVEHWQDYAQSMNDHNNIFLYGHRNPAEMPHFLNCFDIVLAPLQTKVNSRAPTGMGMSPLKLPQYMSYKKAIVASEHPSHREVLKDRETALLVPPTDIKAWVAAIQELINDQDLRNRIGQNAEQEYWQGYSPEVRIAKILEDA